MARKSLAGIDADSLKRALAPAAAILPSAQPKAADLRTVDDFAAEIGRLWRESYERFVQIGEYLEQAKQKLQHGEWIDMVKGRLPFGRIAAFQLMVAARALRSGLVPADRVPANYSTVYHIARLSQEERQRAFAEGIIHPSMKRADIVTFKRRMRRPTSAPGNPDKRTALLQEKQRLLMRLAEIEAELARCGIESPS